MTRSHFFIHCLTTCLTASIVLAVSRVALSADPSSPAPRPAAKSIDEELLQGLDTKLQTGIDEKPATVTSKKPEEKPSAQKPPDKKPTPSPDPLDEQLEHSLSGGEDLGSPGEDQNPLARIVVQMRQVQQRLADKKSDGLTQREQKRISEELQSLIEQLAQQQQQQPQSGDSSPQQASRDKTKPGNAPAGKAPPGDPDKQPAKESAPGVRKNHTDRPAPAIAREVEKKELDRLHLPDKDREEMLQGAPDEFLPGHETSIEEYFKRLVEQEDERP